MIKQNEHNDEYTVMSPHTTQPRWFAVKHKVHRQKGEFLCLPYSKNMLSCP